MAGSKGLLDAGAHITNSTIVTAIARNGYETGIRVSSLGDRCFAAPASIFDGVYFPGFGLEDANPKWEIRHNRDNRLRLFRNGRGAGSDRVHWWNGAIRNEDDSEDV